MAEVRGRKREREGGKRENFTNIEKESDVISFSFSDETSAFS
jgi:hypothetical protein